MSRIGNLPIALPPGVQAAIAGDTVTVTGPLGTLQHRIPAPIHVIVDDAKKQVRVERPNDERENRALHGLTRNLLANMAIGVSKGYQKAIQVVGVGYGAKLQGKTLTIEAGYSHPVHVDVPDCLKVPPPEPGNLMVSGVGSVPCTTVRIQGADKQAVGEFAARLRRIRKAEPYKGKGIRYVGEEVRRKAGKAFAAQE
jgi:large subunit ribosomal protein L6